MAIAHVSSSWIEQPSQPGDVLAHNGAIAASSTLSKAPTTLRAAAEHHEFEIGTAVLIPPLRNDPMYRELLAQEFNSLTPENAMKFDQLHPAPARYTFANADALVTFAETHNMAIHGHTLVWHRSLPNWLTDRSWTQPELSEQLQQHIETVVGHFRDRIASWDVVNEAVDDDATLRKTIWLDTLGAEYIELAFRWAHGADPHALLFYNDYHGEDLGSKSDQIYALVRQLRENDVPIHGVGFQMHTSINDPPDPREVAANIRRLNDLGLQVRITEMDVRILDGNGSSHERLREQARVYRTMLRVCLDAPNCTALTTWGFADHWSWIRHFFGRLDSPLLFDVHYRPKPAYHALLQELQRRTHDFLE